MGRRFGLVLRKRLGKGALPWPLLPAGECIRATALGASEYSVQLSGNTCFISNPGKLLPRQQLPGIGDEAGIAGELHAVFGGTERGGADTLARGQQRPGQRALS